MSKIKSIDKNGKKSTILKEYLLREGDFPTNGNIFLPDSIFNYEYIEIYFRSSNYFYDSMKILSGRPYINLVACNTVEGWGVQYIIAVLMPDESGTMLYPLGNKYLNLGNTIQYGDSTVPVYVKKIVGYK